MAILVPAREVIDSDDFQPKLDHAEETLLAALRRVLDDDWTIYVQPFLNGLHPDFVIFNPKSGLFIIEVKNLNYESYAVTRDGYYTKAQKSGILKSAFDQVKEYKEALVEMEAPLITERKVLLNDNRFYGLVECAVYFHGHTSKKSMEYWRPLEEKKKSYIKFLGSEHVAETGDAMLRQVLHIGRTSKFADFMSSQEFKSAIHSALGYPEMGKLSVEVFKKLSPDQKKYAVSRDERKHIKGAAGSGKTLVLATRAVDAVTRGKNVLVTCFNITMRNYLRDAVNVALRARKIYRVSEGQLQIEHFHRVLYSQSEKDENDRWIDVSQDSDSNNFVKDARSALSKMRSTEKLKSQYTSIFVDEGQDFEDDWIGCLELLLQGPKDRCEFVVMSDPAQNIYANPVISFGARGKPPVLRTSHRLRGRIADVARLWYEKTIKADAETKPEYQAELFGEIYWNDFADFGKAIHACLGSVKNLVNRGIPYADIAVIAPDTYTCRDVLSVLHRESIPTSYTMVDKNESQSLNEISRQKIERARKLQFGRKNGQLKLTTVHSFKGWEWSHIIFLARFGDKTGSRDEIMYTAFTRAQQSLTVVNCMPEYREFGKLLASEGLLTSA